MILKPFIQRWWNKLGVKVNNVSMIPEKMHVRELFFFATQLNAYIKHQEKVPVITVCYPKNRSANALIKSSLSCHVVSTKILRCICNYVGFCTFSTIKETCMEWVWQQQVRFLCIASYHVRTAWDNAVVCVMASSYPRPYKCSIKTLSRTKSQNLNVHRLVLQLPLTNPLKPDVNQIMKV